MTKSKVSEGIVLAAGLIAISLGLSWAGREGLVGADMPTRITMTISALLIAFYGNTIPKVLLRSERAIRARRWSGWILVLAGLATAAIWLAMPMDAAANATLVIVGGAVLLVGLVCALFRGAKG